MCLVVVGLSSAAATQLATALSEQRKIVEAFLTALQARDVAGLLAVDFRGLVVPVSL